MDDKQVKEFENNQIELLKTQLSGYDYACKNLAYYKWYLAEIDRDINEGLYPSTAVKEVIIENKSGQSPQETVINMKCEVEIKIRMLQSYKDYIDLLLDKLTDLEKGLIVHKYFVGFTYKQLENIYYKSDHGIHYDVTRIIKKMLNL